MESADDGPPATDGQRLVVDADVRAAALQHVRAQHRQYDVARVNLVEMMRAARSFGATWADLGEAMDTTRQTAHKRFGSEVD